MSLMTDAIFLVQLTVQYGNALKVDKYGGERILDIPLSHQAWCKGYNWQVGFPHQDWIVLPRENKGYDKNVIILDLAHEEQEEVLREHFWKAVSLLCMICQTLVDTPHIGD